MILEYFDKKTPNIDTFTLNDEFTSDMYDILNNINYIVISDVLVYTKIYDKFGFIKWKCVYDDIIIEQSDLIYIIHDYVIDNMYNLKINDDYLNITNKPNNTYLDIDELYQKLVNYYNIIFNSLPNDNEKFNIYVNSLENAGIIDSITKNKILKLYGEDYTETEIG